MVRDGAAREAYVSFHLLPLYMNPKLQAAVPPGLKKRMQGKACFNFTGVEEAFLPELTTLTAVAVDAAITLKLPWEKPAKARPGYPRGLRSR